MGIDVRKLADGLVEKFCQRAGTMGIALADGKFTTDEFPGLIEAAVLTVEDITQTMKLNSLEKKSLALVLVQRAIEQYGLQDMVGDWIKFVAKKIHDYDIPRVPDWLIDSVLTERRIQDILIMMYSQVIDWVVWWLNRKGWDFGKKTETKTKTKTVLTRPKKK